jgi:hypothetical protein
VRLGVVALATLCALVLRGVDARAAEPPDKAAASQMLVLINADRAAVGLAPLSVSTVAVEVAEAWSASMADTDTLAHNDAWFTSSSRERAGASAVGENVAYNADIADAHRRLMDSPGHRANILDGRFHQIGIGVVRGVTGSYWITEDFLQLRSVPALVAEPAAPPADPSNPPAPSTTTPPRSAVPAVPPSTIAVASTVPTAPSEPPPAPEAAAAESPHVEATVPIDPPAELAAGAGPATPRTSQPSRSVMLLTAFAACGLLMFDVERLSRRLRR